MYALPFARLWRYLLAAALLAPALPHAAQDKYPSRPIEFIVPWGPGGGSDQTARTIAKLMEKELGVSVPVLNVPGGTGSSGMTKLLASPADGYTIAILAWDSLATQATESPSWKIDDIVPLAIMIQLPSALYVAGDRYPDWKAVEKAAKSRPLKVAISGFGSPDDITLHFLSGKGLKLTPVPFAKPGERYSALLGGHVDLLYSPTGNVKSFVDGKQMRPVLLLNRERMEEFPNVPTSVEMGYKITLPQRRAIIVKAGTPPDRLAKLTEVMRKVMKNPKYKEFLRNSSASPKSYVAPKQARVLMHQDVAQMSAILKAMKPK